MLFQSGHERITTADGAVELKAGDVYYAPKGLVATWETVEDVTKLYVIVGQRD